MFHCPGVMRLGDKAAARLKDKFVKLGFACIGRSREDADGAAAARLAEGRRISGANMLQDRRRGGG